MKAPGKTSDRPAAEHAEVAPEISQGSGPAQAEANGKTWLGRSRDNTLTWMGVTALSAAGFAICAWAFLFLLGHAEKSDTTPESVAAPIFAQPATPWIDPGPGEVSEPEEVAEAVDSAEIQRFLSRSTSPPADRQQDDALPSPDGAPTVMFSSGAPAADGEQTHLVSDDEAFWDLCVQYGVPLEDLAARNELTSDTWIATGDILVIPVVPAP